MKKDVTGKDADQKDGPFSLIWLIEPAPLPVMPPRSLIHRRGHSAVDFLTGDDSYPVASGFLGRYHHQIIVCIYFNGQFLNRRKVANHDENPEKNAHPKMGKLEARNALRRCHLGAWSTWQLGGLSGRTRPSHAYRRACRG
ncbi:hypothetical protein QE11421_23305 (plasmid) [Escherichia coli]|nr:hypothetical protein QE11421_23305 [Escherichia coli]